SESDKSITHSQVKAKQRLILISASVFLIGRSLDGLRAGLLIALFFTFFPGQFEYSIGFFSKFWITPLIMFAFWSLEKRLEHGIICLVEIFSLPASG
ncbi:MAG: hypothetical protein HQ562_06550, partial [Candidatus Marinimicrobia bacterium]|nr:hypothetical protein [Candidatus Neomarinimicrobiota bacterium]